VNDPKDQPIDIEEQRAWLNEHKAALGPSCSWKVLAGRLNMKHSTLSLFAGGNYNAPGEKIAETIWRYRQTLSLQAALVGEVPEIPPYFETDTSKQILYALGWAQRGRMSAVAASPGLGKTQSADHYEACNVNVFKFTASPVSESLTGMLQEVLRALGIPAVSGTPQGLSRLIRERVRDLGKPLLIADEAQHLSFKALNEMRSWHDDTGLGVALLGNASLLQTLEGGSRSIERAQLFSRISLKMPLLRPFKSDVDALLEAWRITDEKVCEQIHAIAQQPGALREATFTLEMAHMIAASVKEPLAASHVQDAWAQRTARGVAA
jgi:DNA transposition AAA+ family ATPase